MRRIVSHGLGWVRVVLRMAGVLALGVMLTAGVGQLVRDVSVRWAYVFYLPVHVFGLIALGVDLLLWGRTLRPRFGVAGLGLVGIAVGFALLAGWQRPLPCPKDHASLRILHWNVRWGGGPGRTQQTWDAMVAFSRDRRPDVMVFSEAPEFWWMERPMNELGPRWHVVRHEAEPGSAHWYRMFVVANRPLRVTARHALTHGTAFTVCMEATAEQPEIHLLVVDGVSLLEVWRVPFLRDVARVMDEQARQGKPIDFVVGDFNAPARSIGMDAIRARDYSLASQVSGFRATYPAHLPLYDIDHIWLGREWRVASCAFFDHANSNHRGQLATVWKN